MKTDSSFNLVEYDVILLLDALQQRFNLKNDARLSEYLSLSRPAISKLRHKTIPLSPGILLCMHEATGLSLRDLRALMGDHRQCCLIGA